MTLLSRRPFLFHLGIVLLLCAALFLSFFVLLHKITRHGREVTTPGVSGKVLPAAMVQLKAMRFEVSVDSAYDPMLAPLAVLKQLPDSGAVVKLGRTVYLTVNRTVPLKITLPNLVGLSLGSAKMQLRNNKLLLGDTSYRASNEPGTVLEELYNGTKLWLGKKIPQGSKISLVIGRVEGNKEFDVPSVTSLSLEDALDILEQYHLQVTIVSESGNPIDTARVLVIEQDPADANDSGTFNRMRYGGKMALTVE